MSNLTKLGRRQLKNKATLEPRGASALPRQYNPTVKRAALIHLLRHPEMYLGSVVSGVDLMALKRFRNNILPKFLGSNLPELTEEELEFRSNLIREMLGSEAYKPAPQRQPETCNNISIE